MISLFHTVTLPVNPAAVRTLVFPVQPMSATRTLALDCTAWAADEGVTVVSVQILHDSTLGIFNITTDGSVVKFQASGGTPGTVILAILLTLSNGDIEPVYASLPIIAPAQLPPGSIVSGFAGSNALLFNGQPLLFNGTVMTFNGGAQPVAANNALLFNGQPMTFNGQPLTFGAAK